VGRRAGPRAGCRPEGSHRSGALPVTSFGKPYKPALRALATGQEVTQALRSVPGVKDVRTLVEDGNVVTEVAAAAAGVDESAVKHALARYAIAWRLEVRS